MDSQPVQEPEGIKLSCRMGTTLRQDWENLRNSSDIDTNLFASPFHLHPMPRGGYRKRRIRKVTTYVCTTCYLTFTDGPQAKEHWAEAHGDGEY